jgi:formate-dependent nitrite reductase membrane component NrfD
MEPRLISQTKWRWIIAIYLFFAGLGGGAYVVGVVADFLKWDPIIAKVGIFMGFPCVFVGSMFLIADLGTPKNFWRAFMRPGTSWIARGTIIISLFMVINAFHIGFWIWPFAGTGILENAEGLRQVIGIAGSIFALGTMIYTGILLGAARPIAFWSTAILPLLFLVSALSTGIMAVILVSSILGARSGLVFLEKFDILLIVLEMFVLGFYLQATHRVPESRSSAKIVLTGSVAPLFWIGVALIGLLIPLLLEILGVFVITSGGVKIAVLIGTVCGIFGGFILRQVVLAGGVHAALKAGRFEYALTNV